jgi:hypothetical protein
MTTRFMKTAIVTASTVAIIAILLASPSILAAGAQTATSTSSNSSSSGTSTASSTSVTCQGPGGMGPGFPSSQGGGLMAGGQGFGQGFGGRQSRADVSVGQKISFTSTSGHYFVVGNRAENGTASASLTFTVTGNLTEAYTLSISGTIVIGSTTYTISSGSGQMTPSATSISGQGTTSTSGAFVLQATARGSFVGTTSSVSLDIQSGSTEYLVSLSGSVQS